MGKRIKSTGVILDASSMASAPVSPAGTVALRAKSDATQFQYSANGGAWTDFWQVAAAASLVSIRCLILAWQHRPPLRRSRHSR